MRRMIPASLSLLFSIATLVAAPQQTVQLSAGRGGSPHVRSTYAVRGATIAIEYGRPSLRGRPEAQMMPAGQPWRVGADEATTITTDKPISLGSIHLAPGTYTINAQPGPAWQLIIGRLATPNQWGIPYQPGLEIGRVPMTTARAAKPVEQLTCTIVPNATGGIFRIEWGTVAASAPFVVG